MPAKTESPRPKKKFERLEARISPEQKALLKKAAALEGRSLTDFIISSAAQTARRIIHENEVITLTQRDRDIFVKALLNPKPPNKALRTAAARYKAMVKE